MVSSGYITPYDWTDILLQLAQAYAARAIVFAVASSGAVSVVVVGHGRAKGPAF